MTIAAEDDVGSPEYWRQLNGANRRDRMNQGGDDVARLDRLGVTYTANDNGVHLMIEDKIRVRIDFWPTTGRWQCLSGKRRSRGISGLLDCLNIAHEPVVPFRRADA